MTLLFHTASVRAIGEAKIIPTTKQRAQNRQRTHNFGGREIAQTFTPPNDGRNIDSHFRLCTMPPHFLQCIQSLLFKIHFVQHPLSGEIANTTVRDDEYNAFRNSRGPVFAVCTNTFCSNCVSTIRSLPPFFQPRGNKFSTHRRPSSPGGSAPDHKLTTRR